MKHYLIAVILAITALPSPGVFAQHWTQLPSPVPGKLNFYSTPSKPSLISFNTKLYVSTDSGVAISSDDGSTWTNSSVGLPVGSIVHTNQSLLLECLGGTVFRSVDEGLTWSKPIYGQTNGYLQEINSQLYNHGIMGIGRSIDDGQTWTGWTTGHEFFIMVADSIYLIASDGYSTYGNTMFRSADSGVTWTEVSSLSSPWCLALLQKGNLLFAGSQDRAYVSTDHGSHWTPSRDGMPSKSQVNDLKQYQNKIIAGTSNGVFISTDDGKTWSAINNGLTGEPNVVEVLVADNYLYAFAQIPEATLYHLPLSALQNASVTSKREQDPLLLPNPTTTVVTVSNTSHVTVTNMLGTAVLDVTNHDRTDITLDVSKLPTGTYFLRCEGSTTLQKLIKQ